MDVASLVVPILTGAAGGNLVGAVLKNFILGSLGNTAVVRREQSRWIMARLLARASPPIAQVPGDPAARIQS